MHTTRVLCCVCVVVGFLVEAAFAEESWRARPLITGEYTCAAEAEAPVVALEDSLPPGGADDIVNALW